MNLEEKIKGMNPDQLYSFWALTRMEMSMFGGSETPPYASLHEFDAEWYRLMNTDEEDIISCDLSKVIIEGQND